MQHGGLSRNCLFFIIRYLREYGREYPNYPKTSIVVSVCTKDLSRSEMNKRINALMDLGLPMENIKIHPDNQSVVTPSVVTKRRTEWGCKILGAFVGTDEYVIHELGSKMNRLEKLTDTLLQYPKVQFRYRLHRFCYDPNVNYWLRTQLPLHGNQFVDWFRGQQMRLVASYHVSRRMR